MQDTFLRLALAPATGNTDTIYLQQAKIPVPVPKTPKKPATAAISPIIAPPSTVTTGMYRLSIISMDFPDLRNPGICIPESTSCCATVLGPKPPTSSQVKEKITANEIIINA